MRVQVQACSIALLAIALPVVSCGRLGVDWNEIGDSSAVGGTAGSPGDEGAGGNQQGLGGAVAGSEDGLVLEYRFEEGQGSIVYDTAPATPPINLTIESLAAVTWDESFLQLNERVAISNEAPADKVHRMLTATNELTVEGWVEPESVQLEGPARLLSMSRNEVERNFSLLQDGFSYHLRLWTTEVAGGGLQAFRSAPMAETALTHVVFTHDDGGQESLFINGRQVAEHQRPGSFAVWDPTMGIIVGREFDAEGRSWQGRLGRLALYDHAWNASQVKERFQAGGGLLLEPCAPDCAARYGSALLYENFEQKPVGGFFGNGPEASGELTDDERRSGDLAMRFEQAPLGNEAEIRAPLAGSVSSGELYTRVWLYVPATSIDEGIKVLGLNPGFGTGLDVWLAEEGRIQLRLADGLEPVRSPRSRYPFDQWFCLQVAVHVDDTLGLFAAGVDGQHATDVRARDTLPGAGIERIAYGVAAVAPGQSSSVIYFDDLVVSRRPVPCSD